jgi:hypothetical protein
MRGIGCCIAVLAGTLALAPAAGAVTFGADLGRPADNAYTCSDFLIQGGPTTCSARSLNAYTGEGPVPPVGTGVITSVRVKVGPVTGPMQIVVEEALRNDNAVSPGNPGYFCCKAVDASPVFTPQANAVTEVDVNLPVRQDLTPNGNGVYVDQHLALSVLSPNVPIPANYDSQASLGLWFPAWQLGQERSSVFGTSGGVILFSADWQASGGGFAGGGTLSLADKRAKVDGDTASVELTCELSKKCKGTLTLADQQTIPSPPFTDTVPPLEEGKRAKTYGGGDFKIKPGRTESVEVELKRRGVKLLDEGGGSAKVWGNVNLKNSSALAAAFKLKLKR